MKQNQLQTTFEFPGDAQPGAGCLVAGRKLRDDGIKTAVDHADDVVENWSDIAGDFLARYLDCHGDPFLAEAVRAWATVRGCPDPPSLRAWGSVMQTAARRGLIRKIGYGQVSNPRAHCANAALWHKWIPKK